MKDFSYAREKLFDAVHVLATEPNNVRYRLIQAHRLFHPLRLEDFPKELKKDWEWVMKQLTKYGPVINHKGEVWRGSVENTMGRIKNKTGTRIAGKIFDLYLELNKEKYF